MILELCEFYHRPPTEVLSYMEEENAFIAYAMLHRYQKCQKQH